MADRTSTSQAQSEHDSMAPRPHEDFATFKATDDSHPRVDCRLPRKRTASQACTEDMYAQAWDARALPRRSSLPSPLAVSPAASKMQAHTGRCRLLELPAELREQIWSHTVVEWAVESPSAGSTPTLLRRPIRMDRFNRPQPPAITIASHQLRKETLHLYYQLNEFECWRPLFWLKDWSQSTFVDWLSSLSPKQRKWLGGIVLLYKHESELEYDIEVALAEEGFELEYGVLTNRQELSEYEMCFADLGLPRHFGKKRRWDRWMAGSAN